METRCTGLCWGAILYHLLQRTHVTPTIPVDTSGAKTRRAYGEHATTIQAMWFLLAQATRESAALVVKRIENDGQPNGREPWLELARVYGRNGLDKRPAQLLALEEKSRDIRCQGVSDISDFLVMLDDIWTGFGSLGNPKMNEANKATLHTSIKDLQPHILVRRSTRPGMVYDELKRLIITPRTYLAYDREQREDSIMLKLQERE